MQSYNFTPKAVKFYRNLALRRKKRAVAPNRLYAASMLFIHRFQRLSMQSHNAGNPVSGMLLPSFWPVYVLLIGNDLDHPHPTRKKAGCFKIRVWCCEIATTLFFCASGRTLNPLSFLYIHHVSSLCFILFTCSTC